MEDSPVAPRLALPAVPGLDWALCRRAGRVAARLVPYLLLLTLLGLAGCDGGTQPTQPPYIALIPVITAESGTDVGTQYTYRVTEISGTLHIDETRRVTPRDTVIIPVKPATYRVTISGLPSQCRVQDGAEIYLLVPEGSNTAVWRFLISCQSLITLTTGTDGYAPDDAYIWELKQGGAPVRSGIVGGNDTVRLDGFPPGDYSVELAHVADHCVISSDGGARRPFTTSGGGGARADFRVMCSDPAHRPELLFFAASYHDSTSGLTFRVADPDGDVERYFWDITDCHGTSAITDGRRQRRGLLLRAPSGPDTLTVFGAIELDLPLGQLAGRCTSIRVQDEYGNTTPVVERPIPAAPAAGPQPALFNARLTTTTTLTTQLQVTAASYAGAFAAATLRDGILFPPDGRPDLGVFNALGYPDDVLIPTVPLGGGRPQYYDYYSVIVYLFDAQGNFSRFEDDDLFN